MWALELFVAWIPAWRGIDAADTEADAYRLLDDHAKYYPPGVQLRVVRRWTP